MKVEVKETPIYMLNKTEDYNINLFVNTKKATTIKAMTSLVLGNVLLLQGETPNYHRR